MNEYDIFALIIIVMSTLLALFRGLLREVFSMVAWLGAAVLTFLLYSYVADVLDEALKNRIAVIIISVVMTYIASFLLIAGLNALILEVVKGSRFGPVDRSLGLVFGLLRGLLIVAFIHLSIRVVHGEDPAWLKASQTYGLSQASAELLDGWIAPILQSEDVKSGLQKLKEKDVEDITPDPNSLGENIPEIPEEVKEKAQETMEKMQDLPQVDLPGSGYRGEE